MAGAGLGGDGDLAGLHRPCGGLGVQRVGLAVAAPSGPVGPVDLEHDLACCGKEAGKSGAVGAGALDPQVSTWPSPRAQASRSR